MFGYTIIRTDELEHLKGDRAISDMLDRFDNKQIQVLRDSLNETLGAKARLEDKLTAALAEAKQERETAGRILERNIALQAELDHWRANGQLRDPKTGRLIAKAKAAA